MTNQTGVTVRIMACDREEKYEELRTEFAGNVRSRSAPRSRFTACQVLRLFSVFRTIYKFFAMDTSFLVLATISSIVLRLLLLAV